MSNLINYTELVSSFTDAPKSEEEAKATLLSTLTNEKDKNYSQNINTIKWYLDNQWISKKEQIKMLLSMRNIWEITNKNIADIIDTIDTGHRLDDDQARLTYRFYEKALKDFWWSDEKWLTKELNREEIKTLIYTLYTPWKTLNPYGEKKRRREAAMHLADKYGYTNESIGIRAQLSEFMEIFLGNIISDPNYDNEINWQRYHHLLDALTIAKQSEDKEAKVWMIKLYHMLSKYGTFITKKADLDADESLKEELEKVKKYFSLEKDFQWNLKSYFERYQLEQWLNIAEEIGHNGWKSNIYHSLWIYEWDIFECEEKKEGGKEKAKELRLKAYNCADTRSQKLYTLCYLYTLDKDKDYRNKIEALMNNTEELKNIANFRKTYLWMTYSHILKLREKNNL